VSLFVNLRIALCLILSCVGCFAENWPNWRGPSGNAASRESRLPFEWGSTNNIRWRSKIPGEGFSSPIVWNNRVFLTSSFDHGIRRAVHCVERRTGSILWSREIRDDSPELTSATTGYAAATPATDGRRIVSFFGNAGAVCYDLAGRQLWQRRLGNFESELGLASSPVLHNDRVILLCDHDGKRLNTFDSFVVALDLKDGKTLWKTDRPGIFRSWSTPILVPRSGGKFTVVVNGPNELRGYDLKTGGQLWAVGGVNDWVAPSPVFHQGIIFAGSGKNGPLFAIRAGGKGRGATPSFVWKHAEGGPYVCSPLAYRDCLYVQDEDGALACYNALDGELHYRHELDGKFTASPVAGDGKVYTTNDAGITYVVKAGPAFTLLAENSLGENTLASAAISDGDLFLRTESHLYCVKK
jgi:outer membrane protein assembly factor BamB